MRKEKRPRILFYQSFGFLAIIGLSWLDECLNLSSLVFGDRHWFPEFRQSALSMLLILGVWLLVSASTRRVLEQFQKLEDFMRLCAWCHRVHYKGDWIRLEEFMEKGFDTPTSHGICHLCLAREKAAIAAAAAARQAENPGQA